MAVTSSFGERGAFQRSTFIGIAKLTLPPNLGPEAKVTFGMGERRDEANEAAVHAGVQRAGGGAFVRRRCDLCQSGG